MRSCRIVASSSPVLRRRPNGGINDQAAPMPKPSASTATMPVSGKAGASAFAGAHAVVAPLQKIATGTEGPHSPSTVATS